MMIEIVFQTRNALRSRLETDEKSTTMLCCAAMPRNQTGAAAHSVAERTKRAYSFGTSKAAEHPPMARSPPSPPKTEDFFVFNLTLMAREIGKQAAYPQWVVKRSSLKGGKRDVRLACTCRSCDRVRQAVIENSHATASLTVPSSRIDLNAVGLRLHRLSPLADG